MITFHARQRAAERLGYDPTDAEWAGVIVAITDRATARALMLRRKGGSEEWLVPLSNGVVRVVWDPVTATIVTVLPA